MQCLNRHWGLEPRSEQQKQSSADGAFVIRMLPSKAGTANNVWRVASNSAKRQDDARGIREAPLNPAARGAPFGASGDRVARAAAAWPFTASRFWFQFGGSGNWVRRGHEATNSTNVWHSDDNYVAEPPWATTLRAVQVPSCGGDTCFADMGQAYDDLDGATQRLLCGMAAEADWMQVFPHYQLAAEQSGRRAELQELQALYPRVQHPLVRTHPTTGQRVLYANAIYTRALRHWTPAAAGGDGAGGAGLAGGDAVAGGDALLRELFTLPGVPEYQARVRWQSATDFVMWDNRVLQHYAVSDWGQGQSRADGPASAAGTEPTRLLEHIASLGTRPFFRGDDGRVVESRFVGRR